MNNINIKKIIILSVLIALASVLSYFDAYICSFINGGLFQYKLGLANIVIMVILYNYDLKCSYFASIFKSLIVGLILGGGYISFVLSLIGSMLSLTGMMCFKKMLVKPCFTPFIGLIGGFLHPVGQIIGVSLIYGFNEFFMASILTTPILLIGGVITGVLVGFSAQKINKLLEDKIS